MNGRVECHFDMEFEMITQSSFDEPGSWWWFYEITVASVLESHHDHSEGDIRLDVVGFRVEVLV